MAEVAGLVVGSIPLALMFEKCISFYNQIERLRYKSDALDFLAARASFEQFRLSQIRDRLNQRKLQAAHKKMVDEHLKSTEASLSRLYKKLSHHQAGLEGQLEQLEKSGNRLTRGLKWMATDEETIKEMLSRISELNDDLAVLIPDSQLAGMNYGQFAYSVASSDISELRVVQSAWSGVRPALSNAARVKELRIENFAGLQTGIAPAPRYQITDLSAFQWTDPNTSNTGASLNDVLDRERAIAQLAPTIDYLPEKETTPVLVEWRTGLKSTGSAEEHKYRLDQLVHAVRQMGSSSDQAASSSPHYGNDLASSVRTTSFGVLECIGWLTTDRHYSHIGLVFRLPSVQGGKLISLYDRINLDRSTGVHAPALGTRFSIALQLAIKVANLVAVGWIHKSIRSHSVLMYNQATENSEQGHSSDFKQLYLSGFSYARPGDPETTLKDVSTLPKLHRAYPFYQPPRSVLQKFSLDNVGDPVEPKNELPIASRLNATFDIYGLGVILLEIARWKTIDGIYDEVRMEGRHHRSSRSRSHTPTPFSTGTSVSASTPTPPSTTNLSVNDFQESPMLLRRVDALEPVVGTIYRDVVRKCLTLDGWQPDWSKPVEDGEAAKSNRVGQMSGQIKFFESILASLSQCQA